MYTLHLAKEPFKFSCSHFTVLSAEHAERLHGHNYQVRVAIDLARIDDKLGMAFDFNVVKPKIRMICDELDERILLPSESPYVKIAEKAPQLEVRFHNKRYEFPADDCLRLPVSNVTSEELSRYICERLSTLMADEKSWRAIHVDVEETRGQSVTYTKTRP